MRDHTKMLQRHAVSLRESSVADGRLDGIARDLENAADVIAGWKDPHVMRQRAEEVEVRVWRELLAAEEKNMEAIRKDDVEEIERAARIRREARTKHNRALAELARWQGR